MNRFSSMFSQLLQVFLKTECFHKKRQSLVRKQKFSGDPFTMYSYFGQQWILDGNWLMKMYRHISENDVGTGRANGSCESIYSDCVEQHRVMMINPSQRIDRQLWMRLRMMRYKSYFDPFPNYHICTNAFMIRGFVMRQIRLHKIHTKMDAWRFESGKDSLTQQILRRHLRVLVVGKDGKGYEKEDWWKSNTLWQWNQSNLMIADNQRQEYFKGDLEEKRSHSRLAGGDKANPAMETCESQSRQSTCAF